MGRRTKPFTSEKTAAFTPIATASVSRATAVNPGVLISWRRAKRRSSSTAGATLPRPCQGTDPAWSAGGSGRGVRAWDGESRNWTAGFSGKRTGRSDVHCPHERTGAAHLRDRAAVRRGGGSPRHDRPGGGELGRAPGVVRRGAELARLLRSRLGQVAPDRAGP